MDITPLDIELVRQDPHSNDCLRACALMVFKYFDDSTEKSDIWKKLHVYKKHSGLSGGYFSDLGILAISKNYNVTISHYATHWWNKDVLQAAKKGDKALIKTLKELKKQKDWAGKKEIAKSISYIKRGGKYKIAYPKLETINELLIHRLPVIMNVQAENLYQEPKEKYSHSVVVTGKKSDKYIIRDPYLAVEEVDKDELYYAWVRNGGWMIVLYPKEKIEKRPSVKQPKLIF